MLEYLAHNVCAAEPSTYPCPSLPADSTRAAGAARVNVAIIIGVAAGLSVVSAVAVALLVTRQKREWLRKAAAAALDAPSNAVSSPAAPASPGALRVKGGEATVRRQQRRPAAALPSAMHQVGSGQSTAGDKDSHAPAVEAATLAPGMLARLFGRQPSAAQDGSVGGGEITASAARQDAGAPRHVASSDGSALQVEMAPVNAGADAQGAEQSSDGPVTGHRREAHTPARLDLLQSFPLRQMRTSRARTEDSIGLLEPDAQT